MQALLCDALAAGAEQIAFWSQLLDRINVFPVADGDTGRNLVISLAPLRQNEGDTEKLYRSLLLAARGNSGNIAARFLQDFVCMPSVNDAAFFVVRGRDMAYLAMSDPKPGTMLCVFDRLASFCTEIPLQTNAAWTRRLLLSLEQAVAETINGQKVLQQAGVVDAGALGMYVFFDGFFSRLAGIDYSFSPAHVCFKDKLRITSSFHPEISAGFCIDAVVESTKSQQPSLQTDVDNSIVMRSGQYTKMHFHGIDREEIKAQLSACGEIISWAEDDLTAQTAAFSAPAADSRIHIMTDAAGSISREDAAEYSITLLDSYITMGDTSLPETCFNPGDIYKAMRAGSRCTTAQMSIDERHRYYAGLLGMHKAVLYLCVGSFYTGNYQVASAWKQLHDQSGRFSIVDSGTASGRLAVALHLTARFARQAAEPADVDAFARKVLSTCHEYIFVDTLAYLAASGRLSKTGAFFGDLLRFKPVISPQPDGACKVGMVRSGDEQVLFAMEKLSAVFTPAARCLILLEYTDNRSFVEDVAATVCSRFPKAELLVRPLSLTTGVHTGPGTWAVACGSIE